MTWPGCRPVSNTHATSQNFGGRSCSGHCLTGDSAKLSVLTRVSQTSCGSATKAGITRRPCRRDSCLIAHVWDACHTSLAKLGNTRCSMVAASACWPLRPTRAAAQSASEMPMRSRAASPAGADGKNNGLRASQDRADHHAEYVLWASWISWGLTASTCRDRSRCTVMSGRYPARGKSCAGADPGRTQEQTDEELMTGSETADWY
jgi:hypothetical protein